MIGTSVRTDGVRAPGDEVAAIVGELAARTGLSSRDAYRLRLAADEIVTNVVMHGYRGGGGVVDLTAGADPEWVWLRIEDDAPPFDPAACAAVRYRHEDPLRGTIGGHGLFLAMQSVDDFSYEHTGGRNRNLLRLRRVTRDGGADGQPERDGGG